jgi:hypothetical protein
MTGEDQSRGVNLDLFCHRPQLSVAKPFRYWMRCWMQAVVRYVRVTSRRPCRRHSWDRSGADRYSANQDRCAVTARVTDTAGCAKTSKSRSDAAGRTVRSPRVSRRQSRRICQRRSGNWTDAIRLCLRDFSSRNRCSQFPMGMVKTKS